VNDNRDLRTQALEALGFEVLTILSALVLRMQDRLTEEAESDAFRADIGRLLVELALIGDRSEAPELAGAYAQLPHRDLRGGAAAAG
jgi:hypothetical protein